MLPLGAFEQHGKHLPLKVDEFMVNKIAIESVNKSHDKNIKAVVAPVIWTGYSPYHMDFAGTISIKDETLTNLIIDIVESLIKNKLENGKSEKEIYQYLKNKYGEWIVYDPEFNKKNLLLWIFPLILFIFGGLLIYRKVFIN